MGFVTLVILAFGDLFKIMFIRDSKRHIMPFLNIIGLAYWQKKFLPFEILISFHDDQLKEKFFLVSGLFQNTHTKSNIAHVGFFLLENVCHT